MRNVEGDAPGAIIVICNFRSSEDVLSERPILGLNCNVPRQHRAHQRSRYQIPCLIYCEDEPTQSPLFLRGEEAAIPAQQFFIPYFVQERQPEMNLVRICVEHGRPQKEGKEAAKDRELYHAKRLDRGRFTPLPGVLPQLAPQVGW